MEKLTDNIKRSNPTLWETFGYCTPKILGVAEEELEDKEFYSSKVKELDVEYTEPYMIFCSRSIKKFTISISTNGKGRICNTVQI